MLLQREGVFRLVFDLTESAIQSFTVQLVKIEDYMTY